MCPVPLRLAAGNRENENRKPFQKPGKKTHTRSTFSFFISSKLMPLFSAIFLLNLDQEESSHIPTTLIYRPWDLRWSPRNRCKKYKNTVVCFQKPSFFFPLILSLWEVVEIVPSWKGEFQITNSSFFMDKTSSSEGAALWVLPSGPDAPSSC